jgi:hypothetical protein
MSAVLDVRKVRAILAAERVTHSEYARQSRLSRAYVSRILAGSIEPGELARIRLQRGLVALGLDRQAISA